jgi:hypothetical protein
MPTSAAVIDILQSLLEAEQASVFRFMRAGSPYLTRATLETRGEVERMADRTELHARELADLIERLGGGLRLRPVQPEDQYLSFLSFKFLLPKLAEAKRMTIERCENALRPLKGAPPEVVDLVRRHLAAHQADLEALEAATAASR